MYIDVESTITHNGALQSDSEKTLINYHNNLFDTPKLDTEEGPLT